MPKLSAGTLNDQAARRDIPQPDAALYVAIEPARRHVRQRQGRSAHHADFSDFRDQSVEIRQRRLQAFGAFRETHGNDGLAQLASPADMNDPPIQSRRMALDCGPQFIAKRIINYSNDRSVEVTVRVLNS